MGGTRVGNPGWKPRKHCSQDPLPRCRKDAVTMREQQDEVQSKKSICAIVPKACRMIELAQRKAFRNTGRLV